MDISLKVLLHDNYLSERGTTRSMISLARALRTHLGADCAIAYRKQFSNFNNEKVLNAISREFEIYDYRSIKFLNRYASRSNFDIFYAQKAGDFDGVWLPDLHNFIHVVFQSSDVHGDSYAYISKWLADEMSTRTPMNKFLASRKSDFRLFRSMRKSSDLEYTWRRNPFSDGFRARRRQERSKPNSYLPYPVDLPSPESSLRQKLRIPEEAIVLGSLSARGSFDIPWVRAWLPDFLARQNNFFFLAPNLDPWFSHPRALWLAPLITDLEKSNYISTIDAMIHARQLGESFGLAISEVLSQGKPVFSANLGNDRNHVRTLSSSGLVYHNPASLEELCLQIPRNELPNSLTLKSLVSESHPLLVANKFRCLIDA